MDFPHCNECYRNNVIITAWTIVEQRTTEGCLIDIYKCSVCGYNMSWSYINPDDNLKGDNTIIPVLD